tara:strand:- start:10634 stop:12220 length:1587 start_codon:yes stop_codon:yes gene_type:complete
MPKVLISDKLSPKAEKIFTERGIEVDVITGLERDELIKIIAKYDGLAIRSSTKVTQKVLDAASNLKVVGRAGIGVDNVDIPYATSKGVAVMNTPFGNAITTAEHAISLIMSLVRNIPQANESTHGGKWEKSKYMGTEITGKTLGLIGCGNIGSIVADRALGLKMKVLAYDPFLTEEKALELQVRKVELDELLSSSDIITLHVPMTDQTANIINKDSLEKCKDGVRIVNCARGGLVDEKALKKYIENGKVSGAAIDVFELEPATDSIFFGMEEVICTPHLGASTLEAQENVALQVADQMSDFLTTGAVSNAINMPSISASEAPVLKPFTKVSEQLGLFVGQLMPSDYHEISIDYVGDVSNYNCSPITSAAVAGILNASFPDINMVSAPSIARDKGIAITETKKDEYSAYESYIRINLLSKKETFSIGGTTFSDGKPRIVQINGINLEAELMANMLYVTNNDVPGLIGSLGNILGNEGINIASFNLGRTAPLKDAMALIGIDSPVNEKVISEVKKLDSVVNVKSLNFNIM